MSSTATCVMPVAAPPARLRGLRWLCIFLFACGAVARLAPLLNQDGRLLRQFPTEDGYLMLTIARNIAIGNGMSTAAGTIPTNGTQPLCTFLWAACFAATGGDKTAGVALVLVIEFIIACCSAVVLVCLTRRVLARHPLRDAIALLSAAVWYASPICVPSTMNCLESGTYVLAVMLCVWALITRPAEAAPTWSWGRAFLLGLLLGLAFWVRNDAVWLIGAACLAHVVLAFPGGASLSRRLGESIVMGATTILVALPWLIFNRIRFGSIMPVSGAAESLKKHLGVNLSRLPAVLAEYLFAVLPIPSSMETHPLVIAICVAALVLVMVLVGFLWRWANDLQRTTISIVGLYATGLCLFYGLFFGAGWFLSRYLFPISPFLVMVGTLAFLTALDMRVLPGRAFIPAAAGCLLCLLVLGLNVRLYRNGRHHDHFQVVGWVQAHVAEDVWVGAVQSGTTGFFHDRTINLDGKVNPEALQARLRNEIARYVVEKRVEYLADWAGLAEWARLPAFSEHFSLIVEDRTQDYGLAVLRRRNDANGLSKALAP